jgi:hypothetical protein
MDRISISSWNMENKLSANLKLEELHDDEKKEPEKQSWWKKIL